MNEKKLYFNFLPKLNFEYLSSKYNYLEKTIKNENCDYNLKKLKNENFSYDKKCQNYNFKNKMFQSALSKSIMEDWFGLKLELNLNKLIPAIPSRVNYILWIKNLLTSNIDEMNGSIKAIDIGCGFSCIYSLIGAKLFGWNFVATDVDDVCISGSNTNIKKNNLNHLISVLKVNRENGLLSVIKKFGNFDVCLCNPPFYDDNFTLMENLNDKKYVSTSKKDLMIDGGEFTFILNLIQTSIKISTKIRLFTCLIGFKTNLHKIISYLKQSQISHTYNFIHNGKTRRWLLCWYFDDKIKFSTKCLYRRKIENYIHFDEPVIDIYQFIQKLSRFLEISFQEEYRCKNMVKFYLKCKKCLWRLDNRKNKKNFIKSNSNNSNIPKFENVNSINKNYNTIKYVNLKYYLEYLSQSSANLNLDDCQMCKMIVFCKIDHKYSKTRLTISLVEASDTTLYPELIHYIKRFI